MTQNHDSSPQAGAIAPACSSILSGDDPVFETPAETRAYWAGVARGTAFHADAAPPEGRRTRHDGWSPEKMAHFLEVLAACGVVADACRAVEMSVASAYALRSRAAGRAWGVAWDAVQIHRARTRLADEVMSRALHGCVDKVVRNGEVVAERHRYDNRLTMAVLARLDRLAETRSADSPLLAAMSEDLEEFLDCVESGEDADAFVAARRPGSDRPVDALSFYATGAGNPYEKVPAAEIPVDDLYYDERHDWSLDQDMRAHASGFLLWAEAMEDAGTPPPDGDWAAAFQALRDGIIADMVQRGLLDEDEEPSTSSTLGTQVAGSA